MENGIIMLIFLACLAIVFIVLFAMQIRTYDKHLKEITISTLNIAAAGSAHPETPEKIKLKDLPLQKFHNRAGEPIDFKNILMFCVRGWSMLLCGIRNNDILFAKPVSETAIKHLSFDNPKVLVLKREGKSLKEAIEKDDYAKYKIRRAWAMLPFDEAQIMAKVNEIMQHATFKKLQREYPANFFSDEIMKASLADRIVNYEQEYPNCKKASSKDNVVIVSTTLRNIEGEKDRKVFFSIHPARIIVGQVIQSFHKKETPRNINI